MTPGSRITRQSPRVNPPVDFTEQDKLIGIQGLGKRSDADSNKAFTPSETPTPPLVAPHAKDQFTKFMKVIMETR